MFTDSHCHLTSEPIATRLADVIRRAREQNVTSIVNIGDSLQSSRRAIEQVEYLASCDFETWATVGVHPQHAAEYSFESNGDTSRLRELASHSKVVAIGEIGLDYVYDDTHAQYPGAPRELQQRVLRTQLELARSLELPVVIHNREADDDLLQIVGEFKGAIRGVFHCFGSSWEVAQQVLELGFYLGFTGLVTFNNAEAVREVARRCPLERMLIETDSPYLAPVPHRGKSNEPSYVPLVAETIAKLHGKTIEQIGEITTRNATELFCLNN